MGATTILLALGLAAVAASPTPERIVGGSVTDIAAYPMAVALLVSVSGTFSQACGGTIINTRAILTAAQCTIGEQPSTLRVRAGSSFANSGGTVYPISQIISHPNYDSTTYDSDVAIVKSASNIALGGSVSVGSIASANYNLADNQAVWAVGWGTIFFGGPKSEQLRHVQMWSVNQNVCRGRYALLGRTVTNNMLCAGWIDVGGRDQCQGDAGGPLLHNTIIVGVASWGYQCGTPLYPGVNTRVSSFTNWIVSNA